MAITNSADGAKSRYTQGGEVERFQRRLGWWERNLSVVPRGDDLLVTLAPKYDKRPDLFSVDYLGSALLQWVVLQLNNIVDINEEFIAGKQIRVPDTQRVLFNLLGKRTGGITPKAEQLT